MPFAEVIKDVLTKKCRTLSQWVTNSGENHLSLCNVKYLLNYGDNGVIVFNVLIVADYPFVWLVFGFIYCK